MNSKLLKKIANISLYLVGFVFSWGGMIYATNEAYGFRPIGVFVAFAGYIIILCAVCRYETSSEE